MSEHGVTLVRCVSIAVWSESMLKGSANVVERDDARPDPDVVRSQLERLLKSDQFKNSKRCQTLLTYIVSETLAGRSDHLKERLIGINVFGRNPDYNAAEDPVVRNAAIEVRKRLAQFYMEPGSTDTIRLDLHAGSYIPEFRVLERGPRLREEDPAPQAAELSQPAQGLAQEPVFREVEPEPSSQSSTSAKMNAGPSWLPRAGLILLAILLFGGVVAFLLRRGSGSGITKSGTTMEGVQETPATPSSAPATPVSGESGEVHILAGSQQGGPYLDHSGTQWMPDRYFSGGQAKSGVTDFFFPPADPQLFRTLREGSFTYDIPLKLNQNYEMRLYFVEPQYRYGNRIAGDGENIRLFQVRANDQVILDRFDIIEDAGFASNTIRAFKDITPAKDGKLHLQFVAQREQPLVSAIELIPTNRGTIPPIRIHMSQSEYTDHAGRRWSPDNFYVGGQLFDSGAAVTETPDPDLFNVSRFGNFHYAIPVPPGRYSLTLYLAETWFRSPGQRVFDVTCNGVSLMHQMDIFKQAGFSRVFQKTFHGLEPNGQGKLLISFSPTVNYAGLRALEVSGE
jgi:hypothetical protein